MMGSVKMETRSQGKNAHEWDNVTLNSVDAIDILIRFRHKFDEAYLSKCLYTTDIFSSNGVPDFTEIISCLYIDLDRYIKKAQLHVIEKAMINYLMLGYSFDDFVNALNRDFKKNYKSGDLKRFFRRSCNKILYEYNYDYTKWLHLSENVKIDKNDKYKKCSKCNKYKLLNLENFAKRSDSRDKHDYRCRKCKSVVVNPPKIEEKNLYVLGLCTWI